MMQREIAVLRTRETASRRKLLVGRTTAALPAGAVLVIVRTGDDYRLLAVTADASNQNDPSTLAAFVPPDVVDEVQRVHALEIAAESTTKPSPRKAVQR